MHWQYGGGDEKAISNISRLSFGFSATNNAGLLFLFSTFLFYSTSVPGWTSDECRHIANAEPLGAMLNAASYMSVKKIFTVSVCGTMLCCNVHGQPTVPKNFIETVPPKVATDKWFILNHSGIEFAVTNEKGQLKVTRAKQVHTGQLQLLNGKLVGEDHGEWGGELTFVPADTTQNTKTIKAGNIKQIFRFEGNIYFIDGIAHGTISQGTLYKLDTTQENFDFTKVLDFDDAPEAYAIFKDKILIASHENFYVIQDFKKEEIVKETFWSSLYPNSIAAFDESNIFIGIRSGIVKLDLLTREIKFYKYKE